MINYKYSIPFAQISYLKAQAGSIAENFNKIFSDSFIKQCNMKGVYGKIALERKVFVRNILFGKNLAKKIVTEATKLVFESIFFTRIFV